jgi:hypothetical protein
MDLTFTHNTKEVIQLINFLKGKKEMPEPYDRLCFRTPLDLGLNHGIKLTDNHKECYNSTQIFIIEICSRKKYIHNGYYLHHLAVDKRFNTSASIPEYITNEYTIVKQDDKEIEEDIEEIQRLIFPRKLVIVSHYNAKLNGEYITDRHILIHLLKDICLHKNIPFINPTEVLSGYQQDTVLLPDLGHYTNLAQTTMKEYIYNFAMELYTKDSLTNR